MSRFGIAVFSSALTLESVSGCWISQYMTTSRTQAVVSVPAMVRTWASSERRATVFSWGGSLEDRMEWKMVGISESSGEMAAPAWMSFIWARLSCQGVRKCYMCWKDGKVLVSEP